MYRDEKAFKALIFKARSKLSAIYKSFPLKVELKDIIFESFT